MAAAPALYSGASSLALVGRVSVFSVGVVYGTMKLKYLKAKAKSHAEEANPPSKNLGFPEQ